MAPKKKKKSGKKGKLAKMTEEERILYMEQKALAEEEMRKKKEDMLNQFLKVGLTDNYCDNELISDCVRFHTPGIPYTRKALLFPQIFYTLNKDHNFHTLNKSRYM